MSNIKIKKPSITNISEMPLAKQIEILESRLLYESNLLKTKLANTEKLKLESFQKNCSIHKVYNARLVARIAKLKTATKAK